MRCTSEVTTVDLRWLGNAWVETNACGACGRLGDRCAGSGDMSSATAALDGASASSGAKFGGGGETDEENRLSLPRQAGTDAGNGRGEEKLDDATKGAPSWWGEVDLDC
mmetsp:Transcript_8974/g.19227  ORF Transcript_8974/g.19227 Transcript_8974/m.19227 type:complete len:109 (+) Transcript_8974:311-637(+)